MHASNVPTPDPASTSSSVVTEPVSHEDIAQALQSMFPGHTRIATSLHGGLSTHITWEVEDGTICAELTRESKDTLSGKDETRKVAPKLMIQDLLRQLSERNVFLDGATPGLNQSLKLVDHGTKTGIRIILQPDAFDVERLVLMKQANLAADLFTDLFEEKKVVGRWKPHPSGEFVIGNFGYFAFEGSATAFARPEEIPGLYGSEAARFQQRIDEIEHELKMIDAINDDATLGLYIQPEYGFGIDPEDATIGVTIKTQDLDSVSNIVVTIEKLRTSRPKYEMWKSLSHAAELVFESLLAEKGLSLYTRERNGRTVQDGNKGSEVTMLPRPVAYPGLYSLRVVAQSESARDALHEILGEHDVECIVEDPRGREGDEKYPLLVRNVRAGGFAKFFSSQLPFERP